MSTSEMSSPGKNLWRKPSPGRTTAHVVMRRLAVFDRPNQSPAGIVERDDRFAGNRTTAECDDVGTRLQACRDDESRHQAGMQGADVPDRFPHIFRARHGVSVFTNRSHVSIPNTRWW